MAVAISVDGEVRATSPIGLARPDVAAVHADVPGAARSGFRAGVRLDGVSGEAAGIRVVAIRSDGRLETLAESRVRIASTAQISEILGEIDGPAAGEPVPRERIWVRGWALATTGLVGVVEVLVDGEPAGSARLGLARPDVGELVGFPDASISGWARMVDLSRIAVEHERVTIGAVVRGPGGERRLPEIVVPLESAAPATSSAAPARPGSSSFAGTHPASPTEANGRPTGGSARKLLAFTHSLAIGGAQIYLLELLRNLVADGDLEVTLVAPGDGPLRDDLEAAGVRVHLTPGYAISSVEAYEGQQEELAAWAQPRGFDRALINTMLAFPGADLARRLGLPTVWAIHESYGPDEYWATCYQRGEVPGDVVARGRQALTEADALIFEAEATRRQYVPVGDPARMLTMPFGIDLESIDAHRRATERETARRLFDVPPDCRLVLCLGTVEPRKCQTVLARAFAATADAHPNAVLALVGADDSPYCEALRGYVGETGLSQRIRIVPVVEDPRAWLAAADLLVCASDVESLPRVVLEAMAFEVPVLATSIFGIPEVIEDGANGFLFPPGDLAALAGALGRTLGLDPAALREVGAAGGRTVRRDHDARRYAARVRRLVDAIAEPGPRPREEVTA